MQWSFGSESALYQSIFFPIHVLLVLFSDNQMYYVWKQIEMNTTTKTNKVIMTNYMVLVVVSYCVIAYVIISCDWWWWLLSSWMDYCRCIRFGWCWWRRLYQIKSIVVNGWWHDMAWHGGILFDNGVMLSSHYTQLNSTQINSISHNKSNGNHTHINVLVVVVILLLIIMSSSLQESFLSSVLVVVLHLLSPLLHLLIIMTSWQQLSS